MLLRYTTSMPAKSDRALLEQNWITEWREIYREIAASSPNEGFVAFEPSHPYFRKDYFLRCPCCQTKVDALEQKSLLELQKRLWMAAKAIKQLHQTPTSFWDTYAQGIMQILLKSRVYSPITDGKIPDFAMWSCDVCIESGKAEFANFENAILLIQVGNSAPFFYFDYQLRCAHCQKNFTYTKGEQRWAHEEFIINHESNLRECRNCRRAENRARWVKQTTQTTMTMARAEPTFENLEKAALWLLKIADPRALLYLQRAKNKAPSLEQRQILEAHIATLNQAAVL